MSPAGSLAALSAAIHAGANSVYFGVGKLNMRARSAGITLDNLSTIATQCREAGVKSYLALNTIIYDGEMEEMHALCDAAKSAGVSAVIATDIATIEYARSIGLEVHISVQANVTNFQALEFYARYADTVVLARELTLQQISSIWKKVQEKNLKGPSGQLIRLELFAHGALCVAVSGKCYMSLSQYNHSANRGECFQPCRRKYRVIDEETNEELVIENQYVMSPKDICTIQYLDQITSAGISVLKIEGRGRSADYVAKVTSVYREALNALAEGTYSPEKFDPWIAELNKVFNRGFWHGGHYCGVKLEEWAGSADSQASEQRDEIGVLSNFFIKASVAEFTLKRHSIKNGDTLLIEGPTTGALRFTVENLHISGIPANDAKPNDLLSLRIPQKARRQDKVYLITSRTAETTAS